MLGRNLEIAKQTDFFKWFHLERVGSTVDAAGNEAVEFRASGEQFRSLARLMVRCRGTGEIFEFELSLNRGFVENARNGVFAADYAKSFLLFATPQKDWAQVKSLAEEIEEGSFAGRTVIMHADVPRPDLPDTKSAGYLTYLGKQKEFVQELGAAGLKFSNETVDGVATLMMTIHQK
jgi:hypothetical protein